MKKRNFKKDWMNENRKENGNKTKLMKAKVIKKHIEVIENEHWNEWTK